MRYSATPLTKQLSGVITIIIDWLEANIDDNLKFTGNGKETHFNCPICGESRHRMFVNLESGLVYCHNCGYKSNIVGLIQWVEGISFTRANAIFNDIKGSFVLPETISKDLVSNMFTRDFRKDLKKRAIPLPEEYVPLDPEHTNIRTKAAIKYLHSRKVTDKQIVQHKMGFCMSGEYKNRVIIPIMENDELRFWVARAISSDVKMKEKSPSDEDYQISKSEVIFNIDRAAREYHTCIISEGIFDGLSWGDVGVSLLGKTLYQEQLNILLDYRELLTDGVYVAVDWDAKDKATEMAEELSQYFDVKIINIPKEFDDPNKYLQKNGRKSMYKLIEEAEPYTEFSGLRRMLT